MRKRLTSMQLLSDAYDYHVVQGNHGIHVVSRGFCSCAGYFFRKRCKHVEWVENMKFEKMDIGKAAKRKTVDSSLNALNKLFNGGTYTSNLLFAIFGEPKVGKTLLCVQETYWFMSKGLNVLYIDTEGGTDEIIRKWSEIFTERFRGKERGNLIYASEKDVVELLKAFGVEGKLQAKGGKMEFIVETLNYNDNNIIKAIDENKIDVVIIDSVSAPFRMLLSNQQNFPTRGDMTALLLTSLLSIMEKKDVIGIITNHASWNPANPYQGTDAMKMRGGLVVQHLCKRVVYLSRRKAEGLESYRKIWLVRAEDIEEWSKVAGAKITDAGYFDISDEDTAKLLTKSEAKMVV